jgi:hypothetical protein
MSLVSKLRSACPEVLDDENKARQRVWNFYIDLLLTSTLATAHKLVLLSSFRRDGEVDIRQQIDLDAPMPCIFRPYPPVLGEGFELAPRLAVAMRESVPGTKLPFPNVRAMSAIGGKTDIQRIAPNGRD